MKNPRPFLAFIAALIAALVAIACAPANTRLNTAETDLCKARAAWKLVALAASGALDPKPGSARAELEQAEDALCAALPVAPVVVAVPVSSADAGH